MCGVNCDRLVEYVTSTFLGVFVINFDTKTNHMFGRDAVMSDGASLGMEKHGI